MPRPLTSIEVAELLRVSTHTLARLLADGERAGILPPCVMVGRQRRWYADQLDDWLREVEAWRRSRSGATRTLSRLNWKGRGPVQPPPADRVETVFVELRQD